MTAIGRIRAVDLILEADAGIVQRPLRSFLTVLGTMLGVGALVAVLGLTATAQSQVSARFTALLATTVTVQDTAEDTTNAGALSFPDDFEARTKSILGVRDAGLFWPMPNRITVTNSAVDPEPVPNLDLYAASAGMLRVAKGSFSDGGPYNSFVESRSLRVAVLGYLAAQRLGVNRVSNHPSIKVGGETFAVVGIMASTKRAPELLSAVVIPTSTAKRDFGLPSDHAAMVLETDLGAAGVVSRQVAVALRPDNPKVLRVIPPPDPRALGESVANDLQVLFLLLGGVSLTIGAVGIANMTLVAVMERKREIGIRRAVGARPRDVAKQFLAESGTLGTVGGLLGSAAGVLLVVGVSFSRAWSPVLDTSALLLAPLLGTLVGLIAGLYPSIRAARLAPVEALRG